MLEIRANASFRAVKLDDDDQEIPFTYRLSPAGERLQDFPCEWRSVFGADVLAAEAQGIRALATVRMGFNPDLYEALQFGRVRIYRNGEESTERAFEVYGSPDNIEQRNLQLEFRVRRIT